MTAIADATPGYDRRAAGIILVAGIVLATLTEAIASTVLSLGRATTSLATPMRLPTSSPGWTSDTPQRS